MDAARRYTGSRRRWALAVLAIVLALDILDGTIVNIAAPSIQRSLGAAAAGIEWVVAAYSMTFALLLITGGRLGDMIGYRRMFILGVIGFVLASGCCAAAHSTGDLIAARCALGAAAAMMAPQSTSLVQILYRPHERATVMGLFGTVGGVSAALGPVVGGLIIHADVFGLGWRPIFLINIPAGLGAVVGGIFLLPPGKSSHPVRPDVPGTLLILLAALCLLVPLVEGRSVGWPHWCFWLLGLAGPLIFVFARYTLWRSGRGRSPLVAPELFRLPSFVRGLVLSLTFRSATAGYLFCFTLMLQFGLGYSALGTALTSVPFATSVALGIALLSRKVAAKLGRSLITLGTLVMSLGLAGLTVTVHFEASRLGTTWPLVPWLCCAGLGMGMAIGPLSTIILYHVDIKHAGSASGVLSSVQQLAAAVGVAIGGTLFFGSLKSGMPGGNSVAGYGYAFEISIACMIGLLMISSLLTMRLPKIEGFLKYSPPPRDANVGVTTGGTGA